MRTITNADAPTDNNDHDEIHLKNDPFNIQVDLSSLMIRHNSEERIT